MTPYDPPQAIGSVGPKRPWKIDATSAGHAFTVNGVPSTAPKENSMNVSDYKFTAEEAMRIWCEFRNIVAQLSPGEQTKVMDFVWEQQRRQTWGR